MFPKNTWYVACTPDEIAEKPLGRKICGERLVIYRGLEGKVAAVEDFCPHRGAPLSLGTVQDGQLVCGYHGLVMACDGKVASMPGQRVRGFPCTRTFPAIERYGFIWVWPGDEKLADPAQIHHLEWAVSPDWAYGGGLYHINCEYRLMIDNLMDLTHETYVHATSIGQKEIDESPVTTRTEGDTVVTSRFMENVMAPPFWRSALRANNLADNVIHDDPHGSFGDKHLGFLSHQQNPTGKKEQRQKDENTSPYLGPADLITSFHSNSTCFNRFSMPVFKLYKQ